MEHELFKQVYELLESLGKVSRPRYCQHSNQIVLLVLLWAALHEQPICWACRSRELAELLGVARLPSPATMSRRLRNLDCWQLLSALEKSLRPSQPAEVMLIDARPLEVGYYSKDRDARFGRGAGHTTKGYKFFSIWEVQGHLLAWAVWPMNVDERAVAVDLIQQVAVPGWLIGDKIDDAGSLYEQAGQQNLQLLVYRDSSQELGHRKQSTYRLTSIALQKTVVGKKLLAQRVLVEAFFGQQCTGPVRLHHLPAWVRRWRRVRLWVRAKLILQAAARRQKQGVAA